jgi:hypothetical protein
MASGCVAFVKGKKMTIPWGDEKRRSLKALQLGAFDYAVSPMHIGADVQACAGDGAAELVELYCAAGVAEIERRFA